MAPHWCHPPPPYMYPSVSSYYWPLIRETYCPCHPHPLDAKTSVAVPKKKPTGAINVFVTNLTTDPALSRQDLLNWVNYCLFSNFTHVTELSSGAAYCNFMDMLFPGSINLRKVNFQANFEHEFIHNFKLLQLAFQNVKVDKVIPIVTLVRGRVHDNVEFLQWFKKFFVANYKGRPYNALLARGGVLLGGHPTPSQLIQQKNKKYS